MTTAGYDLKSTLLKVGHHGSSSASSKAFLNKVKPAISIIEVGEANDFGHPTSKTLSALQESGSKVYRTDTNGNIIVTTDGISYTVSTANRNTPSIVPVSTTATSTKPSIGPMASDGPFVGSSKSNKYHYPSCRGAKNIKSANLITFSSSEEARTQGYSPCGICHPP